MVSSGIERDGGDENHQKINFSRSSGDANSQMDDIEEGQARVISEELFDVSDAAQYAKSIRSNNRSTPLSLPLSQTGSSSDEKIMSDEKIRDAENHTTAPSKYGLLDSRLKPHYKQSAFSILKIWGIMILGIMLVVSVLFGSYYRREYRYRNLKVAVYLDQDDTVSSIEPYIANTLKQATEQVYLSQLAGWEIRNSTQLTNKYPDLTFEEAIEKIVYERRVWGAVYVVPNATNQLYQAFINQDTSFNTSELVKSYYISSRDVTTVYSYVEPAFFSLQQYFMQLSTQNILVPLFSNLTTQEQQNLVNNGQSLMFSPINFQINDLLPFLHEITMGPLNVGLIILIIVSFFQFNFFVPIHQSFAPKLMKKHYIIYRMVISQISYIVLSFTFTCVCAAFKIDFNTSIGKGGFMASFCTFYLAMACVGGMNENAALICFATYPPVIGFWLLFWVMSNIAPTFSAIALCPDFYRYGYAFPIHNCNEIIKVYLLNNWKGELGRNYGVLVAWLAISNSLMPLTLTFFAKQMAKKQH